MEASGWCRPQLRPRRPPPEKLDMLDRLLGPWGWGKERGCPCRFVRGRRMFSKNRRELQWRRRREGRTLLGGGGGEYCNTFMGVFFASCFLRTALGLEESLLPPRSLHRLHAESLPLDCGRDSFAQAYPGAWALSYRSLSGCKILKVSPISVFPQT